MHRRSERSPKEKEVPPRDIKSNLLSKDVEFKEITPLNETLSKCSQGKEKDRWQTNSIVPPRRLEIADGNGNDERADDKKVVQLQSSMNRWDIGHLLAETEDTRSATIS